MYSKLLVLFLLFTHQCANAQQTIGLVRTTEKITIDGLDTETAWSFKANESNFTQFSPNPSAPSNQKTSVKLMYDDNALYVFATCYDDADQVSKILSDIPSHNLSGCFGDTNSAVLIINCFSI